MFDSFKIKRDFFTPYNINYMYVKVPSKLISGLGDYPEQSFLSVKSMLYTLISNNFCCLIHCDVFIFLILYFQIRSCNIINTQR